MPTFKIQHPYDQPFGRFRLLRELRDQLTSPHFDTFYMTVAFAKSGPLIRLEDVIQKWRYDGKEIKAIFGTDQHGTSREALEFALQNFSEIHVVQIGSPFAVTFHPKIYVFSGHEKATAYIGSNNLTVGGTETNFESMIKLELELPRETEILEEIIAGWTQCLSLATPLTHEILRELVNRGTVWSEKRMWVNKGTVGLSSQPGDTPTLRLVPPSPLPQNRILSEPQPEFPVSAADAPFTSPADALVIQIDPQHNGEVFLSKSAVNQNPDFFGFPFTGRTTPKFARNTAYPQRVPDPVVDLTVYASDHRVVAQHLNFGLNTVFYDKKGEIRITVPQDVVASTPEYSILVMRLSPAPRIDYTLDIFVPGHPEYDRLLATCNQTMPSGGRAVPRKFGWL